MGRPYRAHAFTDGARDAVALRRCVETGLPEPYRGYTLTVTDGGCTILLDGEPYCECADLDAARICIDHEIDGVPCEDCGGVGWVLYQPTPWAAERRIECWLCGGRGLYQ